MHNRNSEFGQYAYQLCKGRGLEIGALHKPFDLDADVLYLDRFDTEELRQAYSGDSRVSEIRPVQLVSRSGNYYPFIADAALDFVISSHVLEHTTNPGRIIEEWLRIIKPQGIVYMVFPDKRHCFDRKRDLTTVEHLMKDYHNKVETTDIEHYRDFIYNTEGQDGIARKPNEELVNRCWREQSSIHVHTFTSDSAVEFINALKSDLKFNVELFFPQALHIHFALRKN